MELSSLCKVFGKFKFIYYRIILLVYLVFFLEIILPEYAKKGSKAWHNNKSFYKHKKRLRFNSKRQEYKRRSDGKSYDKYWHHNRIIVDSWFFHMARLWWKTDKFFFQKWEKSHQKWTYRGRVNKVWFQKQQAWAKMRKLARGVRIKKLRALKRRKLLMKKQVWLQSVSTQVRRLSSKGIRRSPLLHLKFRKLMTAIRGVRWGKSSQLKKFHSSTSNILRIRQRKLRVKLRKINKGNVQRLYMAERKRAKRWGKFEVSLRPSSNFPPIARVLLKTNFGPHINFLKRDKPTFFSLRTLLKFKQSTLSRAIDKLMSQMFEEQVLLTRWNTLAAFNQLDIARHSRANPASQYWNIQKLQRCLKSRPKLLRRNAVIDSDAILGWYKNYKQVTIILKEQDLTYEETLLWFERYPWVVKHPFRLPMNPSDFMQNSFFLVNDSKFKIISNRQLEIIFSKWGQVLEAPVKNKLFLLLQKRSNIYQTKYRLKEKTLAVLTHDLQQILLSSVLPCLMAYPRLQANSLRFIWKIVLRYAMAEMQRNIRILKAALNNLRVIHLVESLKRIARQLGRGVTLRTDNELLARRNRGFMKRRSERNAYLTNITLLLKTSPLDYILKRAQRYSVWPKYRSHPEFATYANKYHPKFQNALAKYTQLQLKSAATRRFRYSVVFKHMRKLKEAQVSYKVMELHVPLLRRIFSNEKPDLRFSYARYKWELRAKKFPHKNFVVRYPARSRFLNRGRPLRVHKNMKRIPPKRCGLDYTFSSRVRILLPGKKKKKRINTKRFLKLALKPSFSLRGKRISSSKVLLGNRDTRKQKQTRLSELSFKKKDCSINGLDLSVKKLLRTQIGYNKQLSFKKTKTSCSFKLSQHLSTPHIRRQNNFFWGYYNSLTEEQQKRLLFSVYLFDLAWTDLPGVFFNRGWYHFQKNMPLFHGRSMDKRVMMFRPSVHKFVNKRIEHNRIQAHAILTNVLPPIRRKVGRFPKFLVFRDRFLKFAVYKKFKKIQRHVIRNRCKIRLSRVAGFKNLVFMGQYRKALLRMHKICKRKAFFYYNMLGPRLRKKDFFFESRTITTWLSRKIRSKVFSPNLFIKKFFYKQLCVYQDLFQLYNTQKKLAFPLKGFAHKYKWKNPLHFKTFFSDTPRVRGNHALFILLKKKQRHWRLYGRVPWRRRRRVFKRNTKLKFRMHSRHLRDRVLSLKDLSVLLFSSKKKTFLPIIKIFNGMAAHEFGGAFSYGFRHFCAFPKRLKSLVTNKKMQHSCLPSGYLLKRALQRVPKRHRLRRLLTKVLFTIKTFYREASAIQKKKVFPVYMLRKHFFSGSRALKKINSRKFWKNCVQSYIHPTFSELQVFGKNWLANRRFRMVVLKFQKQDKKPMFYRPYFWANKYFPWAFTTAGQICFIKLETASNLPLALWKPIFRDVEKNEPTMRNLLHYLPGFNLLANHFSVMLLSFYLRSLVGQQTRLLSNNSPNSTKKYKKILWRYILLLRIFYKNYYLVKKTKTLPSHYGLYLVQRYLYLTGQLDTGFLNRRRDRASRILKLVYVTRYIKRKSMGSVRKKKNLFKLKTLFDRIFFWLYRVPDVSFLISSRIKRTTLLPPSISSQFLYRKRVKFLV